MNTEKLAKSIQHLRDLKDGWGDCPTAKHYSEQILSHAENFIIQLFNTMEKRGKELDFPSISPMEDGTIDIFFHKKFKLLINIDAEDDYAFYGELLDESHGKEWQGSKEKVIEEISKWLVEIL